MTVSQPSNAADEVVDLVRSLIRFDTSNTGELETTKGEAECARWVAEQLEEVGYRPSTSRPERPAGPTCSPGLRVPTPRAAP